MSKYIWDNSEYSIDEITEAANKANLSVDEYISTNNIQVVDDEVKEEQQTEEVITDPPKATEPEKAEVVKEIETPPFVPHPDGDAYYDKLPMMDKEKAAYMDWKSKNKPKEIKPAYQGAPPVDISEGIATKININGKIEEFEEEVSEDFEYVSADPETYKLITEAEERKAKGEDKQFITASDGKQVEVTSITEDGGFLEKYYPGRFYSEMPKMGGYGMGDPKLYDREQQDIFGQDKSVDASEFITPIQNELTRRSAAQLRNKLKGDESTYVEMNLAALDNYGQGDVNATNLKEYYKTGTLTRDAYNKIERAKNKFDFGTYKKSEKEIFDKYKSTGIFDKEAFLRLAANAGDYAYDDQGNLIGVSLPTTEEPIAPMQEGQLGFDKGDVEIINQKTEEYHQKAPTVEVLLEARNNAFFELLAIDKEIAQSVKLGTEPEARGVVENIINMLSGDALTGDQVKLAAQAGDEGSYVGKNIMKIMSKDPLAVRHNEKLIEVLSLDRAIKLNSNLMTIEEEGNISKFTRDFQEVMTGTSSVPGELGGGYMTAGYSPESAAAYYSDVMREAGLQVDQDIVDKDINNSSIDELVVEGAANIAPLLMAIRGAKAIQVTTKGGSVYGVKPALQYIDKVFKGFSKGKGTATTKVMNLLNGISKEVVTIAAANEFQETVFNTQKLPLTDAVIFGTGNSFVAGASKYMATKYIPYFSEFARTRMGVVANGAGKLVAGGVSATAIGKSAELINASASYWATGDEVAFDKAMEHITSLNQLTADVVLFTALGMRGEAVTEVKNRILALDSRSPLTVNAAKTLGIKEFSSPKEVAEALDAKMKELGVDKMNSAQMLSLIHI